MFIYEIAEFFYNAIIKPLMSISSAVYFNLGGYFMLIHRGTQEIRTERLILRRFKIEDYKDMFTWASNPQVTKYLSYKPHKTPNDSKELLSQWVKYYKSKRTYNWAIEYNGKAIGSISVVSKHRSECHLGWQIDSLYWNKGIMTEAAKAVLDYLFNAGFKKVAAAHDTENIGSGRVMQKIGMTKYCTVPNAVLDKDDRIYERDCYEISKSDWQRKKEDKKC